MTNTYLSFKDHKIWITVNGKEVEHFSASLNEETNEISCWIPSENDKPFAVCGQSVGDAEPYDYSFDVYLDGHRCLRKVFRKEKWGQIRTLSYSTVSSTEVRDFKFGSLETTDDDTFLEGSSSLQDIGEIKVNVFRAVVLSKPVSKALRLDSIPEPGKVHERSKKALNHQIKLGETRQLHKAYKFTKFDPLEKLATFIFRYRPLAVLQANGIAPRDPTPVKEERQSTPSSSSARKRRSTGIKHESDIEEVSPEENDDGDDRESALLERLSSFQDEIEKLRKEIQEVRSKKATQRPRKVVKTEPKTPFVPGEIIDLT